MEIICYDCKITYNKIFKQWEGKLRLFFLTKKLFGFTEENYSPSICYGAVGKSFDSVQKKLNKIRTALVKYYNPDFDSHLQNNVTRKTGHETLGIGKYRWSEKYLEWVPSAETLEDLKLL